MWSILVDFIKDFNTKNKKLEVEANQIHTKLFTFMERQSWRVQLYDNIHNLWSDRYSELVAELIAEGEDSSNSSEIRQRASLGGEISQRALIHNANIIRIYLRLQRVNFKEEFQRDMFDIYEYENWAMHLSKEELELCKWIHKYMKDLEEIFVPCHDLFLESFEENSESDKKITVSHFISYLGLIKGGQEYSAQLFYQDLTEQITSFLEKIDKKANASPKLVEVYNNTKNDMMAHLQRVKERDRKENK
ncbi:MAG TPA: hypothetical protein VK119_01080 [Bacillota bacterium]|nr:hypothetical protein [Bacillota bacterium]